MTILGALVRPERVLLWCDTEIFDDSGAPIGVGSKLALSGLGPAVIGAGSMRLVRSAARSVLASASLDQVERRLPAELRIAAAKLAPGLTRRNPGWCTGQCIIAAGYSPAAGRMLAWQFAGAALFEPALISTFSLPAAEELEQQIGRVTGIGGVLAIARQQIALLRRRLPRATGEGLTVLELSENGAHLARIPGFAPATCAAAEERIAGTAEPPLIGQTSNEHAG